METVQNEERMEGWLYILRFNRFGWNCSRKRYLILQYNCLKSFKSIPTSEKQEPVRTAIIDSCIRVTDNGRESIHRKVLFVFSLCNTSDHNDQLKLGASSPEDAARWIHFLQDAALRDTDPTKSFITCSKKRLGVSKRSSNKLSIDWSWRSSVQWEARASDVIAPSPWKIFGCHNGLRLFKEAKDWDSPVRHWGNHPAIMAVGVVNGPSEAIFQTLMSLGPSRSEWDFCFYRGSLVEHLDGHTDIVHKLLYSDWLPWGMKRRDLLLRRYWRREDDGTYVILYHSVYHMKCLPQKGYVRACLKSGGFVITPVNKGKHSVVKHMLAIDWKSWKLCLRSSSARCITIHMLGRVAALREMFKVKEGSSSHQFSSMEFIKDISLPHSDKEEISPTKFHTPECIKESSNNKEVNDLVETPTFEPASLTSERLSLIGLHDPLDEFFDVPEPTEYDQYDNDWPSEKPSQPKLSSTAGFVKILQELTVQKKGNTELIEARREESLLCLYGATLPNDPNCSSPCSWAPGDPSSFLIRGETYLEDNRKIKAKGTLMQLVGVDWLQSNTREDNLAARPGSIVQKYAERGGPEFFFVINIQVPGTTAYTLALYYMMKTPLQDTPLLQNFVDGDDAYRNSRFKLIPYISKGSWIVKQSVGKKACLIGQALEVHYFRGSNYLESEIDVGSSTVARGVVNLVLGYLNNLVIEMAFLIQANKPEELPEVLLGTCRLNQMDSSKAGLVKP